MLLNNAEERRVFESVREKREGVRMCLWRGKGGRG